MLKRRLVKTVTAVLAASVVGVLAIPAAPAQAARRSCGYISCTWYFTKSETSDIKDGLAITAIPTAFVPIAGPITAASLGLNSGVISIMANHGYCLKLKLAPVTRQVQQGFFSC